MFRNDKTSSIIEPHQLIHPGCTILSIHKHQSMFRKSCRSAIRHTLLRRLSAEPIQEQNFPTSATLAGWPGFSGQVRYNDRVSTTDTITEGLDDEKNFRTAIPSVLRRVGRVLIISTSNSRDKIPRFKSLGNFDYLKVGTE